MDTTRFFQSIPDKLSKFFVPNQILADIILLKTAVIQIAIFIFISSLALLILSLSHHKLKKSLKLLKASSSSILSRIADQTKLSRRPITSKK